MRAGTTTRRLGPATVALTLSVLSTGCGAGQGARDPGQEPAAASAPVSAAPALVVTLTADDSVLVGDSVVSTDAELKAQLDAHPNHRWVVVADRGLEYGQVLDLVARLKGLGVQRVDLNMDQDAAAAEPEPAGTASAAPTPPVPEPAPPADPSPPPPPKAESLPEVKVKNIGLHVGGGTNSDTEKAPFRAAVEKQFDAFRACYKHINDPQKGGIFGVDLRIPKGGGAPTVSQPRTGLGPKAFRDCMVTAFQAVEFEAPAKGATVISYSLKFSAE